MARPFTSVLIDTYNHERFIEQAIVSVLEQDFPASEREILVVDDGSTDGTPEIVKKFAPQVRLLRKENGGQASAFNAGIPECRGEIIAFLDGDDWWATQKLSRVADILGTNKEMGMVGHAIIESFSDGTERTSAPEKDERFRLDSMASARVFRLRKSYLGTSRMILRTKVAQRILPVPELLVIQADEYLFTLAAILSELAILQEAMTHYRIHGANLYLSAGNGDKGLRLKQQVMAGLASLLPTALRAHGASADVAECIVEIIQAEADQMRLMLDGGASWETIKTESKLYEVLHADASPWHRLFRALMMGPALLLPPRRFYAARRWLTSQEWYTQIRRKVLPVPELTRVAGPKEFKA